MKNAVIEKATICSYTSAGERHLQIDETDTATINRELKVQKWAIWDPTEEI